MTSPVEEKEKCRTQIIGEGLFYLTACAPIEMTGDDVEREVRSQAIAGTSRGWRLSDDETFSGGQPNPCVCDQDPSRKHWLFDC